MSDGGREAFFAACRNGDGERLRELLREDPELVAARDADGATGLHLAAGHATAVRILLEAGADPNARDEGDNALPLHFAAGGGHVESVRALLDAGSDVHGHGDLHELDVIGWATAFRNVHREVVDLLLERGARHHVFSAVALADLDLIRAVVETGPDAVQRRLSRFEQEQTALHYVIAPPDGLACGRFRDGDHYPMLGLLIELGADVEATDAKGRTPLEVAALRGDREATRRLHAAGATWPSPGGVEDDDPGAALAGSVDRLVPMLSVPDPDATIDWYEQIGFRLAGRHVEDGRTHWASLCLGDAEIMLVPGAEPPAGTSVWIRTDRLDDLHRRLRARQIEHARSSLDGAPPSTPAFPFAADLYTAFYGQRELAVRDPNGVELWFYEPVE